MNRRSLLVLLWGVAFLLLSVALVGVAYATVITMGDSYHDGNSTDHFNLDTFEGGEAHDLTTMQGNSTSTYINMNRICEDDVALGNHLIAKHGWSDQTELAMYNDFRIAVQSSLEEVSHKLYDSPPDLCTLMADGYNEHCNGHPDFYMNRTLADTHWTTARSKYESAYSLLYSCQGLLGYPTTAYLDNLTATVTTVKTSPPTNGPCEYPNCHMGD